MGECHLTNEFLLTSLSPLKNLFVFLQHHAALPCSSMCSQTQVLVIYTCAVSTQATCISAWIFFFAILFFWCTFVHTCKWIILYFFFSFYPQDKWFLLRHPCGHFLASTLQKTIHPEGQSNLQQAKPTLTHHLSTIDSNYLALVNQTSAASFFFSLVSNILPIFVVLLF